MTAKTWLIRTLLASCLVATSSAGAQSRITFSPTRQHPSDLEVGGDLLHVPPGQTRFITYEDLLTLPQDTYRVTDDANCTPPATLSGISLEKLPALLNAAPTAHMVTALCDDNYKANYPAAYFKNHHPILVLRINGQPPDKWPLAEGNASMGPYMISHPTFKAAYKILAHTDEPQIPWGVIRIDFRNEPTVYTPITPTSTDPAIHQGFAIAQQNCFRCHNQGTEGGTKSHMTFTTIGRIASTNPTLFDRYILNPTAINPRSQMAASPTYDAPTLAALRAYFTTFAEAPK